MTIQIIGVILVVITLINLILTTRLFDYKKKGKLFKQQDNLMNIEDHIFEDLIDYCKTKHNLDTFRCFDTDQISLACKDGDKNSIIIELKFPLRDRGTPEYQSALELMKEEIDEWRNRNA